MSYQFRIGFLNRSGVAVYNPAKHRYKGLLGPFMNLLIGLYDPINVSIVIFDEESFGDCDSSNCTGLLGPVQRGDIDTVETFLTFKTNADSIVGLKPGPVMGATSCSITSILPKSDTIREDVTKSLSLFTLDTVLFLASLLFFLFSIPFIMWYFRPKLSIIKTNSPPIIWPMVCVILQQEPSSKDLFHRYALRFIWLSIAFTVFFVTSLYSGSFTTDLAAKAPVETIDSLEDVANCNRIPVWMESALCKRTLTDGPDEVTEVIINRTVHMGTGVFIVNVSMEMKDLEDYVFTLTGIEFAGIRLTHCAFPSNSSLEQWYQSPKTSPAHLSFVALNSNLSPDNTEILVRLHEHQFESGLVYQIRFHKWNKYFAKSLDVLSEKNSSCWYKVFTQITPALARFNQLHTNNYKQLFYYFLFMIPICIFILIGEHSTAWLRSNKCIKMKLVQPFKVVKTVKLSK